MVSVAPEQLKRDAEQMFRTSDIPETFEFVERLSPLNKRLFVVDLWEALSKVAISGDEECVRGLVETIEAWEATAELDAAPEVTAAIRAPGEYRALRIA